MVAPGSTDPLNLRKSLVDRKGALLGFVK